MGFIFFSEGKFVACFVEWSYFKIEMGSHENAGLFCLRIGPLKRT